MTDPTPPLGQLPEPDAWRITDGEGGYDYRDHEPEAVNVAWAARYGRKHETLHTADRMRAYALQERAAERLRIAAAIREAWHHGHAAHWRRGGEYQHGMLSGLDAAVEIALGAEPGKDAP